MARKCFTSSRDTAKPLRCSHPYRNIDPCPALRMNLGGRRANPRRGFGRVGETIMVGGGCPPNAILFVVWGLS